MDPELGGDFTRCHTGFKKAHDLFAEAFYPLPSLLHRVRGYVVGIRKNLKVLKAIVRLDSILMMHNLAGIKGMAKGLFHQPSVLQHKDAANTENPVPVLGDCSALPTVMVRTDLPSVLVVPVAEHLLGNGSGSGFRYDAMPQGFVARNGHLMRPEMVHLDDTKEFAADSARDMSLHRYLLVQV